MAIVIAGYEYDGSAYAVTTFAAAQTVANVGDTVMLAYENNKRNTNWIGRLTIAKDITLEGALPNRGISLSAFIGLLIVTTDFSMTNLSIFSTDICVVIAVADITVNLYGNTLIGTGCTCAQNSTINAYNNLVSTTGNGFFITNGTLNAYNDTFYRCSYGLYQDGSGAITANNNIFYSCGTECKNTISGSNNAGQDGTVPATGAIDLNAIDPGFVRDNLNDEYPDDFRIIKGSVLATAGIDMGLTEDIDGIPYVDGFPIGASAGLSYPKHLLTDAVGGRWVATNVIPDNLPLGVTAGVDSAIVGTFDEAARNTNPGVTNVTKDADYKIIGIDYTGTFDEAARNTNPGAPNVLKDINYKIMGIDYTGAYDAALLSVDPGITNVLKSINYIINGTPLVGIFDESLRNIDPGVTRVAVNTDYKILDVPKRGTYDPTAPVPDPNDDHWKYSVPLVNQSTIPEPSTAMESRAPNLYTLNGALLTIIRRHFAMGDNIELDTMKHYVWDKDDKLSKILIEPVYRWNPKNIQQRPAVIVKRGPWKVNQIGIGSRNTGAPDTDGYAEDAQAVHVSGVHSFFCIGTTGLEAEEIAQEVVNCLMSFQQVIRNQLCLGRFFLTDVPPASKIDECQDHFAVPVNVEYSMQWNWKLLRQAPIWARFGSYTIQQ